MQTHLPWKELGYGIGGLVLLLGLYVGAYFGCASRGLGTIAEPIVRNAEQEVTETLPDGTERTRVVPFTITEIVPRFVVVANYPLGETIGADLLPTFFAPIHELDRRVRADYWDDLTSVIPTPPGYCR